MRATSVFCFSLALVFVSRHFWLTPITNVYQEEISARTESPPSEIEEAIADERRSNKIFRITSEMEEAIAEEHRFRNTQDGFEESHRTQEALGRDEGESKRIISKGEKDELTDVTKKIEEEERHYEKEKSKGRLMNISVDRQ